MQQKILSYFLLSPCTTVNFLSNNFYTPASGNYMKMFPKGKIRACNKTSLSTADSSFGSFTIERSCPVLLILYCEIAEHHPHFIGLKHNMKESQ